MIGYGMFVTQVVNFLMIGIVLFAVVRSINRVLDRIEGEKKKAAETGGGTAASAVVPTDPQLDTLREILVELRKKDVTSSES